MDAAVAALDHRGPDGHGKRYFADDDVFVGHTRLAVIDLTPAGAQPMSNADESVWISFNGEIYNFQDLRRELEDSGRTFRSSSDTEVILQLYEERGDDFVRHLNGIFGLAIYDRKRRRVLLARDHMGVKPLYYSDRGGKLGFASEIKALLAADIVDREVDWQAIYDYFTFLYVPCPRTAFAGVRQLPPAHTLTYDLDTQRVSVQRYWDVREAAAELDEPGSYRDAMRELLEDAVRRQLVSDVPVGVFLSGGIDSATLTALSARAHREKLKTFTVVFEGTGIAPYDERAGAERISKHVGTDHTEVMVRVDDPDEVFSIGECFDQPFGNPTFYLSYLVSRATKKYVTVALSGAGGDELFAGYPRYKALGTSGLLSRFPSAVNDPLRRLAALVPEDPDQPLIRRSKLLLRGVGQPLAEQYLRWTYYSSDADKAGLLGPLLRSHPSLHPSRRIFDGLLEQAPPGELLSRIQYVDYATFLLDNILEYTDKTSMAVGLESRVPMLDHRLVALSLRIPSEEKIRGGRTKAILRDAYPELLPREILEAPKQGFCPPLPQWMRDHFDRYFDTDLTESALMKQGVIDHGYVQRLRGEHQARKRDNSMELFGVLMFDRWFNKHIA